MSIPQWDPSNALLDDFNNTIDPSIAFAQQQQTPQPPNNNVNFNQFQNTQLQQRLQNGMSRPSSASQFSPQYNPNSAIPAKRGLPDGFTASPRQGMPQQFTNNFSNGLAGQQMTPQFQHLQNANANPNTPSPTLPQQGFNPALLQNENAASPSPFTPSVQGFPGRNMSPATVGMGGQMHMNGMHMNPAAHQQMNVNNGMANGNHRFAMTPQQMQAMAMQNHQMSQQDQADSARRLAEAKHQAMLKQAANMQNAGMNPQQAQQAGNPQLQTLRNNAQANFLRMQQTLLRPQNLDQFTRQATQLMIQNGKQFNPVFQCGGRQLHGCHIFARVMALGGSKTINDNQNWPHLAGQLGLTPDQSPNAGMELAAYWAQNLLMYEQYVFRTLSQERAKLNAITGAAPGGPQQQSNQFPQTQQPGPQINKQGSPPQQRLQEQQQHLQQVMQQRALQQAQMQNAQAQAPAGMMNQQPAMPQQQQQQGILPPQSRMQAPPATPSHPPSVVRDQTPMSQHAPSTRASIEPSVKPEVSARLQINGAGSVSGSPQVHHLQGPPGTAMSASQMTPSRQMSVSSTQMPPKEAVIAQQAPQPEPAHPELSVEALQQRFYNYTYAGIPLDTPEFYPMMVALDEQKPNMPDLMDLRVVDVQALTCSLESRIPGEVRLALDTLTLLSSNDRVHMKLDDCEELVTAMIDCAEDLIDFLSNNAAEVSDVMELQSYEELVKETKLEMASLQPVSLVGTEDYALDRAAEHLLCIFSILQNFSFGDLDPAGFVADLIAGPKVMRMITTCLRQIGTRESVLRSSRNTVDFYKDLIIYLSNMSTFINLPGREEAACILQYLLAFAPVQAPRNDPSVKFYFASFESSIHRFLPAAVDVLAKLLAREEPNARLMRTILTDTSLDPNFDNLATLYGMSVAPMPEAYMNLTSPKIRMRKPYLAQGLLAAELLLGFLPASEFVTARQWLQSEDGFVRRLFWLISQGIPLPPRQQGQVTHLEEESDVDHALARRATSLLKKLSIKARDPDMIVDTDNDVTKSAFLHFMKTSRLDAVDTKQLAVFLQHGL